MGFTYNPLLKVGLDQVGAGGGASVAGSDTQVQYNDSGSLGASADLTWDDTGKVLGVGGDVNLDDGGTYTTTVQTITPTANRTISFPDATGTVGLVAGSSGQVIYNNAGAYAGVSTMTFDGTSVTLAGRLINSYTSLASSPAKVFTGTWFTGGTATTTKPHFLIEPTGTTSTAWSTSGTGLGVNAASGFAGNLLDLQVNGTRQAAISSAGEVQGTTLKVGSDFGKGIISYSNNTISFNAYGSINLSISNAGWANNVWTGGTPWVIGSTGNESGNSDRNGSPIRIQPRGGSGNGNAAYLQFYTGLSTTSGTTGHSSELCVQTILPATGTPGLAFGGATSSFPALKRISTTLQARLADDSAYTTIDAQLRAQGTAPASASATGTAGDIRYDADYIYVCTATNTWKRAALATW